MSSSKHVFLSGAVASIDNWGGWQYSNMHVIMQRKQSILNNRAKHEFMNIAPAPLTKSIELAAPLIFFVHSCMFMSVDGNLISCNHLFIKALHVNFYFSHLSNVYVVYVILLYERLII